MSYDLILEAREGTAVPEEAARELAARVAKLSAAKFGEITCLGGGGSLVGVGLSKDDVEVAKLYKALVKLANAAEVRIYDPQRGAHVDLDSPGRYPPGWVPSRPVPGKSTAARVKAFVAEDLRADGFALRGKWTAFRQRDGFEEKLVFNIGKGRLAGQFTVDVCRFFPFPECEPYEMHGNQRMGIIVSGKDAWYEDSATGFGEMRRDLRGHVLPRFDAFPTLVSLVAGVDGGELPLEQTFGPSSGWAEYRFAFASAAVDRRAAAIAALQVVLREHSKCHARLHLEKLIAEGAPTEWIASTRKRLDEYERSADDWVHRREEAARRKLDELQSLG